VEGRDVEVRSSARGPGTAAGGAGPCACARTPEVPPARARARRLTFPDLGAFLGLLVALFPKCPMCWAAYASLCGGAWLARVSSSPWSYTALVALTGVVLVVGLRRSSRRGRIPVWIGLAGVAALVAARSLFPAASWLGLVGLALLGSLPLLSRLEPGRFPIPFPSFRRKGLP